MRPSAHLIALNPERATLLAAKAEEYEQRIAEYIGDPANNRLIQEFTVRIKLFNLLLQNKEITSEDAKKELALFKPGMPEIEKQWLIDTALTLLQRYNSSSVEALLLMKKLHGGTGLPGLTDKESNQ